MSPLRNVRSLKENVYVEPLVAAAPERRLSYAHPASSPNSPILRPMNPQPLDAAQYKRCKQ
jgi:hypothetical protein